MGARVLVVDDDPWILRMVTATLQKKDFVVDTAREGRQALERAQANPPDVIISDVMMPVMDGWAFVQRLRGIPRLASIPVIFLTALGKDEAKLRSLGMGPEDFLPKPFRFEELEKRVTAALKSAPASGATGPAPGTNPGVTPQSGAHPVPNPQSGAHPMPSPPNAPPQGAPPAGYPGYPPGYPYGPGYPGAPPPAGYGPQPGYPGYAPPYASGYPGQNPYAPPAQPGGPFAPYPNAGQPSKTPVRGPGEAAPEPPPAEPPAQSQAPQQPPQSGLTEPAAQPPAQPAQPPAQPPAPEATEPAAAESATSRRLPSGDRLPAIAPGTPGSRRTTALNGRLEQLGLSSLLVMMEMERKDGVLSLRDSDTGMVGRIFLRGGQVISAKLDEKPDQDGKQCVYTMLAWKAGTFSFSATRVDMEDTINSSTTHLLMEGARLIDEAARGGSDDLDGDFL